MIEKIKRVNDSGRPHYRLGDAIVHRNDAAEDILDTKYKGTIGQDYITKASPDSFDFHNVTDKRGKGVDLELLKSLVQEHTDRYSYDTPSKDDLVIHVRTGDMKLVTEKKQVNWMKRVIMRNRKCPIVIVTAMHCHCHTKPGIGRLQEIIDFAKLNNRSVTIRSSETPDADFCYLVNAKRLIVTNGNFSKLAYMCCGGDRYVMRPIIIPVRKNK